MSHSRPNKITKTAEYARQCRIVACGLDSGQSIEAIAKQLGRSGRQVYRIQDNFKQLGWPATKATELLAEQLGETHSAHQTS